MKHIHGVEIRLLDHNGIPIAEGAPHKRTESSLLRFNGQVGSRNICLRPGKKFRVEVSIHNKFKFYAAGGVKIVIVANGIYAGDPERRVHQRHGMWWIDAKDDMNGPALSGEGMRYVIEGFTVWNKRRASREEHTSFLAPDVGDNHKTATTNWVTHEHYCANAGCIAVFVERGNIVDEDEEAGISLGNRSSMPSPVPIRYDEFLSLNSSNAYPYVFEFRNADSYDSQPGAKNSDVFGRDRDVLYADEDELVYDTDRSIESESEDEAVATDESDSESASTSIGESDIQSDSHTDSLISQNSEASLPRGRKRRARSPAPQPQRKRAKTNAEKNAEADAGNASFTNNRTKNAEADAANASYGYNFASSTGCNDWDRDDDEPDLPCVKREPEIKVERSESVTFPAFSKRSHDSRIRRGGVVDLTLDDSDEEHGAGYDKSSGIKSMSKKLADMRKKGDDTPVNAPRKVWPADRSHRSKLLGAL